MVSLADLPEPGDRRAGDHAETVEIDGLGADRVQVRVDELGVAQLVLGDVDRVDRQIVVDALQRLAIARIALGQLGILLPQVGLDQLGRGQEPQDGDVAPGRVAANAAAGASGSDPPRSAPSAAGAARVARPAPASPARPRKVRRSVAPSEDRVRIGSCTTINSPRHRRYGGPCELLMRCGAGRTDQGKAFARPRPRSFARASGQHVLRAIENLAFDPTCAGHYLVNTFATEPIPATEHKFSVTSQLAGRWYVASQDSIVWKLTDTPPPAPRLQVCTRITGSGSTIR